MLQRRSYRTDASTSMLWIADKPGRNTVLAAAQLSAPEHIQVFGVHELNTNIFNVALYRYVLDMQAQSIDS